MVKGIFEIFVLYLLVPSPVSVLGFSVHPRAAGLCSSSRDRGHICLWAEQLNYQNVKDIIAGAAFLGAGGGGPSDMAEDMLDNALGENVSIPMVTMHNVPDDDWAVVSAYLGSPDKARKLSGFMTYSSLTTAVKALQESSGKTANYVFPLEIGAVNSIAPLVVAQNLKIPVVDCDTAGRAMPTLACATFAPVDGLLNEGTAVANEVLSGTMLPQSATAVFQVDDPLGAEAMAGALVASDAFGGLGALAIWMVKGVDLKRYAIEGGLSKSKSFGATIRNNDPNGDVAGLAVSAMDRLGMKAKVLGKNMKVTAFDTSTGVLDNGRIVLKYEDSNTTMVVNSLNENIIAYRSDKTSPLIMSPDMLCWIRPDGTTLDNSVMEGIVKGGEPMVVHAIGIESPDELKKTEIVGEYLRIIQDVGYAGPYSPFNARED